MFVKNYVLVNLRNNLIYCHFLAGEFSCLGIADLQAFPAFDAQVANCSEITVHSLHSVVLTKGKAVATSNATIIPQDELLLRRNRFRIVTPLAVEGTSLQENRSPDTRSVVHRESLYVEDHSGHSNYGIERG